MELPGDYQYPQASPGFLHPNDKHMSTATESTQPSMQSHDARWSTVSQSSASSRPSSYAPSEGMRSPPLEQKSFATELPTMEETREEHDERRKRQSQHAPKYAYNPQHYVAYNQRGN